MVSDSLSALSCCSCHWNQTATGPLLSSAPTPGSQPLLHPTAMYTQICSLDSQTLSQLSHKWPPAEHGLKHSTTQAAAVLDCARATMTRVVHEYASGVSKWRGGGW